VSVTIAVVIFDLDGLLVDSEPAQIAAWERFLERHDRKLKPELLSRMFGLRIWDSAQLIIDELNLALTVEEVVFERDEIFFTGLEDQLRPMPGAQRLVEALREAGVPLGLGTSGHRRYVDVALGVLGLRDAFEVEVTGGDVARGKPHPDIYLMAAERLGQTASQCLALEDAPLGVASAKAAGMLCLAVPNEMTATLPGFDVADAVLSSLDDVIPWLKQREMLAGLTPGQ
jgi:HAD superfamily hydrolase (TIGR01509 family)